EFRHERTVGMVDDVGQKFACGGFGLDACYELAAWRTDDLDLDEGEALIERGNDLLLHLDEIGSVIDQRALLAGRLDQLRRSERPLLRGGRQHRRARPSEERCGFDGGAN